MSSAVTNHGRKPPIARRASVRNKNVHRCVRVTPRRSSSVISVARRAAVQVGDGPALRRDRAEAAADRREVGVGGQPGELARQPAGG